MKVAPSCSLEPSQFRLQLSWFWLLAGAASTLVLLLFPMGAPVVLTASSVVLLGWQLITQRRLPLAMPSAVIVTLLGIAAYILINTSWSPSQADALRAAGVVLLTTVILFLMLNALDGTEPVMLRSIAAGLVVGIALGGVVLCVESFGAQVIWRFFVNYLSVLVPPSQHLSVRADGSVGIGAYLINRNMSAFTVLFWPAVLLLERAHLPHRIKTLGLIALVPGVAAVFRSEHATSQIAFIVGALVFGIYQFYPWFVRRFLQVVWVVAVLLVVPMAIVAFQNRLYLASWLTGSAQHRIVIWGYTADQVSRAPLLGVGVASARVRLEAGNEGHRKAPGSKFELSTASHSHNAYLQVWYEAGAVGAALLLALGLLVLQAIAEVSEAARGHLQATFIVCAAVAASGFSIWAPWLLATFGIVAVCSAVALALRPPTPAA
jgi:O-antigen ligase